MRKSPKKKPAKKSPARPTGASAPVARREPTAEDIRRRAYDLYVRRGGAPGHDVEDWIAAERELRGS